MSQNSVLGLITVILLLTSVNGSGFFTLIGEDISTRTNSFIQIVKAKSKCIYGECCIDHFIPGDFAGLQANLTAELFGQHIIVNELASVLQAHYSDNMSKKPLVLSFQGPSGTGKTFVTDLIADYMYTRGTSSRFLHRLTGRLDFPLDSKVEEYKAKLSELITASIADCPRSLFIFDEVEKMPEGIFENIPSLLDYHRQLKGMQTSEAIYIFLSNAHGEEIISELLDLSEGGKLRESTVVSDFKEVLELVVYNQGGLKKSSIIQAHLVDYFYPFLPLEKRHIESCVRMAFQRRGKTPTEELVKQISNECATYTHNYSTSGCKRIDTCSRKYAASL